MYHQIRAHYDDSTITVYQAYNSGIALPAVANQRLDASSSFKTERMTWIKPSWGWMLYRAGYSYKDKNQSHILALRIPHEYFHKLLSTSVLSSDLSAEAKDGNHVRIQWDPERDVRLRRLDYRSIQIGIAKHLVADWVKNGIAEIEDVTDKARELKRLLDEGIVDDEELTKRGLVPEEKEYSLPENIAQIVRLSQTNDGD